MTIDPRVSAGQHFDRALVLLDRARRWTTASIAFGAAALALLAVLACHLTPANVATIETIDVAACSVLSELPAVGPWIALACPGEEAALDAALRRALAAQGDAGTMGALKAERGTVAVSRVVGGKRRHVGYSPASVAGAVQRELDAASGNGGR